MIPFAIKHDEIVTNKAAKWRVCWLLAQFSLFVLCTLTLSKAIQAAEIHSKGTAKIAIIIDDIGYNRRAGERIIALPEALTYAVIPFTPFAKTLAELAFNNHKELILHLPMEAIHRKQLDAGGITSNQSKYELKDLVHRSLSAVPHVIGFNNHMGSLLTTDRKAMEWVMEEASSTPLFFIDSVTNALSVAGEVASEHNIPNLRRDVFLDNTPSEKEIHKAFTRLISKAKKNGYAIGIAHPHPGTISYLSTHLNDLTSIGVELVSVSTLIKAHWAPEVQPSSNPLFHIIASLPAPLQTRFHFEL